MPRPRIAHRIALVMALLVVGIVPASVAADTSASRPIWPSLAVDGDDFVHVVYDNADGLGLIYATNRSGKWVRKRITSGDDALPHLAVDHLDRVHIIFRRTFSDSPRRLYYVTNRDGSWVTTKLPWTAPASTIRLAVAPDRKLHAVYATDTATYYTTNDGGPWVTERLDVGFGTSPVVAVGRDGSVHIAFGQCLNDGEDGCDGEGIYYRTNRSGEWDQRRLSMMQLDRATDLVVDATGAPHLVYQRPYFIQGREEMGRGLFHMTDRHGRWTKEKITTDGRNARLAIDRNGKVHVAYHRDDEGKVGIYFATNEDGLWSYATAIKERAIYHEMGIDSRGYVRLAFMRMVIDPGVYYARQSASGWSRLELMD